MQPSWWNRWIQVIPVLAGLLALERTASAKILDEFDAPQRANWEDANPASLPLPGGQQANGRFTFTLPPPGQPYFVSSIKTSETFELVEGRTIEFRVDLVSGMGPDSFAIVGFIPQATGANSLAGYGLAKSETDILITKGINKYFYNENPTPSVKNDNVTLVLNLSVRSGVVHILGRVLDKDDGNRVIWERSFVDTPAADVLSDGTDSPPAPYLNLVGNFALYLYADGGTDPSGYQVVYDNAETFVCDAVQVDDFAASQRTGWEDANPASLPLPGGQQADGVFTFALPPPGQPYFVSSRKTTATYELTEGTRHEFAVDLVSGQGPDSFAILAWIPTATGPNSLAGYGLAKSETDVLITKGINKYFYNENPTPPIKNNNVRLSLTLTVQRGNVVIQARVLDKDANNAVLFERTFVDTPAADVFSDGADSPPAPFITSGNVVLYLYADGGTDPAGYQVIYDNLEVCVPPAGANLPPVLSEIAPAPGANFLPASTRLTFTVTDDQPLPDSAIEVVLNGTPYTTANGLILGPAGATRTASLAGLEVDTDYSGEIRVTDAGGLSRSAVVFFDTFSLANRVVEIEDYNFESGGYFNNPIRTAEFGGQGDNSYTDRIGTPEVDFFDTRTTPNGEDTTYRTVDPIRMGKSLDRRRPSFDNDAAVYDYDVGDLAAGEWMNYTRDFAAGTYEIYLREAVVNFAQADSVLEQVTTDPSQGNQTVSLLGSFLGRTSGFTFRNVPLTDGSGLNKLRLRLSGRTTLRLRTITADTTSGNRLLNYLLFLPVTDAGDQPVSVAALSPAPGTTVDTVSPTLEVTLQNRDTTVNTATVQLTVNGTQVTPAVAPSATGATITYALSPLPPSGSTVNARLVFRDNTDREIVTQWQFVVTYPFLDPATRIAGTGKDSGFQLRVVQAPLDVPLENSLDRAESQLASNSTIARVVDTNAVIDLINFNKRFGESAGNFADDVMVPGIDPDLTGNGDNDFAVEILTYLDLPAGVHRFGVVTDDGFKIASGTPPISSGAVPIAFRNGGSANQTFDFVVTQAGLYAFRMVWYERGGSGHAEWFSVERDSGNRHLINAPGEPAAIKAWRTVELAPVEFVLESSPTVGGPYTAEPGAIINAAARTATLSAPSAPRFYRLRAASAVRLRTPVLQGATLTVAWE